MAWAQRQYIKKQYDDAAKAILNLAGTDQSFEIVNNWRAAHAFPLNTFQARLRTKARSFDNNSTVAQRTKRLSSIMHKLERYQTMKLSQIQDIGGCRAIVKNIGIVNKLVNEYKRSGIKHTLVKEDNYILHPKNSGYRGVHLIYSYFSDKNTVYNGLKIEVQIRSNLQHAWATAVETVGTFTHQSLKSSQGATDWLRFFALMGSVIALREKAHIIPDTPTNYDELKEELIEYEQRLDVRNNLSRFGSTLQMLEEDAQPNNHFFLIELNPTGNEVIVIGYSKSEIVKASADYLKAERNLSEKSNIVLVSADSLDGLRRAYPNYFLDTKLFLGLVEDAIQ